MTSEPLNGVVLRMQEINAQQLFSSLALPRVEPSKQQLDIWRTFEAHAQRKGVRSFPTSPAIVADFLNTLPDERLEETCQALQIIHDSVGASSPVCTLAVRTVLERRLRTECPRSWDRADRLAFAAVPPEIRSILVKRENARDAGLRQAQNKLAAERKKLPTTTEKAEDGLPKTEL